MTPWAEVIGDPVDHAKSPILHGFWLEKAGLDGVYRRTRVAADGLAGFFEGRRADPGWRGCNVTIPHKLAVMPLLDRIDARAAAIGAVNTVVVEDGVLVGYNTDAAGFLEPLRPWLAERHRWRVARVLGAGGAARAVAHALSGEGFALVIAARDVAKAGALAAELPDARAVPLTALAGPRDFDWGDTGGRLDLLVNTTSLGMTGQPPLDVHPTQLPPHAIVYDAVYAPVETPLLAMARAGGHPVIGGLAMLIGQGAAAFARFYGVPAPRRHDAELIERLLA